MPETLYVAPASFVVYAASKLPHDYFVPECRSLLRRALPAIAALMAVSALVETYGIL